ncbi:pentapeptide repeat-containing protein [Methanocaldococcus sp. 16A]
MIKKYITRDKFIDEFIKCLESGKDFELSNATVGGDISIKDIYERIKDKELKGCKIYKEIDEGIGTIVISININIYINNVKFNGKFEVHYEMSDIKDMGMLIKVIFNKDVEFGKSIFKGKANFVGGEFKGKVDFIDTIFEGEAYFKDNKFKRGAYFLDAKFKGGACFRKTIFEGEVMFLKAIFKETADFEDAIFNKDVEFKNSIFEGVANFRNGKFEREVYFKETKFYGEVMFLKAKFKKEAYFEEAIFKNAKFIKTTFEKDANFKNTKNLKLLFGESTFNGIADFRDIYFGLLSFVDCTFENLALFRKGKIKFKKSKKFEISLKKPDIHWIHTIVNVINNTIKDKCLAIFLNVQFLNKHSKIENFPLSKTSFLKTDVRDVMLLCEIKKEKILSHKLFKNGENNKGIYKEAYTILKNHLNYNSILAEYRNLRISIENNRTYEEASDLYKMEMELKKEYSKWYEKFAIILYGLISDYGESIHKPIFGIFFLIFATPFVLTLVYYLDLNSFINNQISNIIPEFLLPYIPIYIEHLKSVLGAKFYRGNSKSLLEVIIYCLYSVFLMIVMGNLYIALRRRLSRK